MVERTNFGKLKVVIDPPDLIEIQTKSYSDFLQIDVPAGWTSNVCFGGADMKTLFVTAGNSFYGLKMKVRGASPQ